MITVSAPARALCSTTRNPTRTRPLKRRARYHHATDCQTGFDFFAVVLVLGITGWVLWQRLQPPAWDRLLYQIYELPASTTADQLKQAGYIDLTAPQSSRLVEVDTFFSDNALAGDNILKTFTVEADEPVIRVFCRDKNSLLVKMTTYYVRQQFAEDPGRPFDLQREERAGADGTVEVWLNARTPDGRQAPESDLLLYCHAG